MTAEASPVVLFDGVCGLCTRSVRFIIRRDSARLFRFASLQSDAGAAIAAEHGVDTTRLETLVLIEGGAAYVRSEAALRIARRLRLPWRLVGGLLLVPRLLREPIYRLIAHYRYRLFGHLDSDWRPGEGFEDRFLKDQPDEQS